MTNQNHEITNTRFTNETKNIVTLIWENLQLLCLGLTIAGQILIGGSYIIGQGIWLVANIICLCRDFALGRPAADKVKNATLTAITATLCANYFLGIF
jgi:hypothetical protein